MSTKINVAKKFKQTSYKFYQENTLMRTCCYSSQDRVLSGNVYPDEESPLSRGHTTKVFRLLQGLKMQKSYELHIKVPLVHLEVPKYYSNICGCFRKESNREALLVKTDFFPDAFYSNFKFNDGAFKISVRKLFYDCTNLSIRQLQLLLT